MRREEKKLLSPRRRALAVLAMSLAAPRAPGQGTGGRSRLTPDASRLTPFARVVPGYRLRFPEDEGSHPDFRIEWWYVTGWLTPGGDAPLGFQITFFRARPQLVHDNPSAFAPREIMIAHAAVSDPALGSLIHAQRAARAGFGLAGADPGRTRAWIDDWRLEQTGSTYHAAIAAREFSLRLALNAAQPPIKQGQDGYSQKGPAPESASYYYSLPHLNVAGILIRENRKQPVNGVAWLDHEWSSQYLSTDAVGWDWIGINLDDGGALMAFRMRDKRGSRYWAGGSLRRRDGRIDVFSPDEVRFVPGREWKSARTGTTYPVSWRVSAGTLELAIEPLFDDQEHDTRPTTGAIYWEGAVQAVSGGKRVGRGYLELTGYGKRLEL